MDNNNGDRLSNHTSVDCVDGSVTVNASAGNQNGNIEIFEPEELVVSTLEDENDSDFTEGDLSLREAIALANEREGADTITFDPSLNDGAIALDDSLGRNFELNDELSIDGLGRDNLTLDGGFILKVAENADVTIDGLDLKGGTVDNLGNLTFSNSTVREISNADGTSDISAIVSRGGNANIINSTIKDNAGNDSIGVVIESGTATVRGSTIANNSGGTSDPAGIVIEPDGIVEIINSTIVNNSSRSGGGVVNAGMVEISNSTIANNHGGRTAGGIINRGEATVSSSIVAKNTGNNGTFAVGDIFNLDDGVFVSGGNNLIGNGDDAAGFVNGENGDLVGSDGEDPLIPQSELLIDPQLGNLQDNGGLTETLALLDNSPALDAGSNPNNLATDQRGNGFARTAGNATDIGAYEIQSNGDGQMNEELVVSTLDDENDDDFGEGNLSLREAIALANEQAGADTITFDDSLNGNMVLSQGELTIADSLSINGLGVANLTIDGNASSRIFKIDDGNSEIDIDVTLDGLSIINGFVAEEAMDSNGGGILNQENLTISRSNITNNRAEDPTSQGSNTSRGGGIYTTGALNLIDSTVSGNYAIFGGGVYSLETIADISDSTISDNEGGFVGGGLYHQNSELNLTNSTVTGNEASFAFGGVALNSSTANISYSTVSNNVAQYGSTGGINLSDSTGNISHSTITGNTALRDSGGGIGVNSSTATIENSTINNNSANNNGGGVNSGFSSKINLSNSTITGNNALQAGSGIYQQPELIIENGQGVLSGNVSLTSTIVAGNANNKDIGGDGFDSQGNNLIGNVKSASSTFISSESDLVGTVDNPVDSRLGELQDNGGLTQTIALLEDSPAIDAGSNPNNLTTDQRGDGFARTVGNSTDIGAFELQGDGVVIPTELVVSTLEDENDGDFGEGDLSLREAIALANEREGADTISFDDSLNGSAIALNSALGREIIIYDSVAINGLGRDNLTLDGSFIFNIEAHTDAAFEGLNLVGGKIDSLGNLTFSNSSISQTAGVGSADNSAIISRGNATIVNSSIKDNDGGGKVGIVFESGTGTIEHSAITGNDSSDYASSGVIISRDATVEIANSTIANNIARSNAGINNSGTANIFNSTIANNSGGLGSGGVKSLDGGTTTVTSSILANNTGNSGGELPIGDISISGTGKFVSGGNNLISNGDDATGFVNGENGDLVGSDGNEPFAPQTELLIDPQLGDLQNNGGLTETLALLEDSPAIDAGSNPNSLATDQRGEGFDRTVGNSTDIGAYEVQDPGVVIPTELIVSTLEDENDGDYSQGDLSLREAIAIAESGDTISFSSDLSGSSINLSLGELVIDKNLTISGLGSEQLTINAAEDSRVFKIDDGNAEVDLDVIIDGLAITGADISRKPAQDSAGGGIFSSENLELTNSLVSGNIAGVAGGGIYSSGGSLNISNSNIDDNSVSRNTALSFSSGGGIAVLDSTVEINNSQITNNRASLGAGGIEVLDSSSLTVADSNVTDNSGLNAGGINSINSSVNIQNSSVSNNTTGSFEGSGAISSDSDSILTIDRSIIDSNSGADNIDRGPSEGGPLNAFSAGIGARGTTNISNSTISNNIALRGDREDIDTDIKIGHGIRNTGLLDIINSTFVGNTDEGIKNEGGSVNIANSTIVNDISGFSVANPESDSSVTSSIIVINDSGSRPTVDSNQNLIANYDDIGLGELQENGGLTPTIALQEDSPAIDAGSNPQNLTTDQRGEGFTRTVGNGTDIGAFELQTISSEDIIGTEGRDVLQGTNESDRIFGLDGRDFIQGLNGDDLINGGNGGDRLLGAAGNDTITDGAGNDIVFGDEGDDVLIASDAGDDLFSGGAGSDTYLYDFNADAASSDRDRVLDFSQGEDLIAFRPFASDLVVFDEFADLDTDGSGILDSEDERINVRGASTTIDFSNLFGRDADSDTITLIGVTNLDESNFLFNEIVVGS